MSGASKRANGRASGPALQSVFLAVLAHSAEVKGANGAGKQATLKRRTASAEMVIPACFVVVVVVFVVVVIFVVVFVFVVVVVVFVVVVVVFVVVVVVFFNDFSEKK